MVFGIERLFGLGSSTPQATAPAGPGMGTIIMSTLSYIGKTLVIIAPFLIAAFLIYRMKRFPVKAYFFKRRGRNVEVVKDRAGRIRAPGGVEKYRFMKFKNRNIRIEPPDLHKVFHGPKGNYLFLWENNAGEYLPMDILERDNPGTADFKPINRSIRFWENVEIRDALTRHGIKNKWLQYAPHISFVLLAIFIIVLFAIIKGDLSDAAKTVAQATVEMAKLRAGVDGGAPGY